MSRKERSNSLFGSNFQRRSQGSRIGAATLYGGVLGDFCNVACDCLVHNFLIAAVQDNRFFRVFSQICTLSPISDEESSIGLQSGSWAGTGNTISQWRISGDCVSLFPNGSSLFVLISNINERRYTHLRKATAHWTRQKILNEIQIKSWTLRKRPLTCLSSPVNKISESDSQ